jgi:broad specificity phosphatase PhoE
MPDGAPTRVILVRHGATDWSRAGRHTGRTDVPLSEAGRVQCRQLRPVLEAVIGRAEDEPMVFSSSLLRARETAALVMPEIEPEDSHLLLEVDYGKYEGLTSAEIAQIDPNWNMYTQGCPGGESITAVAARCDSFIAKMERMAAGRTVVAFTHGHLSRVLTARALGHDPAVGSVFYNDTATIGVIDERKGAPVLTAWNLGAK